MVFFFQCYLYYVFSISTCSLFLMMMMMMMSSLVFAGPTGLTLKLIHRDSPESPLYPGNLTQIQRMERAFQQSIDHEQKLLSTWHRMKQVNNSNHSTNSKSLDAARPPVSVANYIYMVQIGIGTFAAPTAPGRQYPEFYYFLLDTGSNLLWLQCKGNNTRTFLQNQPPFDWESSLTYAALPAYSPHPFCRKYGYLNEGGFCGYNVRYADGASTAGILAKEKLTLHADNGFEVIDNFVFGCGLRQNEPTLGQNPRGQNPISGIVGLGGGSESLIHQLRDRTQNKFEYCLKPWYDPNPINTFLRFGSDTKIVEGGQGVQSTSIVPVRGDTIYYVNMEGISVAGNRVFYPDSSVFKSRPDGTGGCVFDSGCSVTRLSPQIYEPLKNYLIIYFFRRYNIRTVAPVGRFELCFERYGFSAYPTITFHFNGGNFDIEPSAAFYQYDRAFCFTIRQSELINSFSVVFGSLQQVNHRILYDLEIKKISWAKENCVTLR